MNRSFFTKGLSHSAVVAPRLPKVLLPILFKQLREVQPHHAVALSSRAGHLKYHGIIKNSWNVSEKFMK